MNSQALNNQLIKQHTNNVLSCMQLLGFDKEANEKQFKIVLNSSVFAKPNAKAFEVVVNFLLSQLDTERWQKNFSQYWPPLNKDQQKEFKDMTFTWLNELSSASSSLKQTSSTQTNIKSQHQYLLQLIKFPIMTKSLLLSPGGLKLCELLYALSLYVIIARVIKSSTSLIKIISF